MWRFNEKCVTLQKFREEYDSKKDYNAENSDNQMDVVPGNGTRRVAFYNAVTHFARSVWTYALV